MNTKEITVIPPEGYEIDRENSTLERIVFKALPNKGLPKTWEELGLVRGYFVSSHSVPTSPIDSFIAADHARNTWPTLEEAEASIALAQLCQLRDRYNDGWKPDWTNSKPKYVIWNYRNTPGGVSEVVSFPLAFKTLNLRNQFLENFRDLIEKAKPLL